MLRSSLVCCLASLSMLCGPGLSSAAAEEKPSGKLRVYLGTYTGPKSKGIYTCELDLADGSLSEPASVVQHMGSSVNNARQSEPHAHSINMDPAGRFVFAADLGLDKVIVYRLDAERGKLEVNDYPSGNVAPGAGPRHFAFQPS